MSRRPTRIQKERRLLVLLALACFFVGMFVVVEQAYARPPVPPDVFVAVRSYWHTRAERVKAFDVIACETGGKYNTTAQNGQYIGLFQMGSWARARYGHGPSASSQARAAHRLYAVAGWRPWRNCA